MSDMGAQIRGLGDQLRWAAEIRPPHLGTHSEVLFAGMGGSGIAGDYAAAIASANTTRLVVQKGYGPLPTWATRQRPLVIAASYSGNTEETLDLALSSHEKGLPVAVVTTGGKLAEMGRERSWPAVMVPAGLQPRAAVGHMVGATLKLLEGAHAIDDQRFALVEAADLVDATVAEGGRRWEEARAIATRLVGRICIIYAGGPITSPVAQRWKTQVNENAKMPAWWSLLPELDHNEITGWETLPELTSQSLGIVALVDRSDHPRIRARLAHTARLTQDAVPWVAEIASEGTSPLARLMSLTAVGDLVSWMLAEAAGVDPVPVATIERLKELLAEDHS
ncbi:MAG: bifunctional phosphoglucose/phosphomannose isomerase [Actinobacteria bacterium]|nr:bifunctional phosphoglucose/phosphomannose isomerase [Actinomycetota bacterium]